jgi:hypothetical protein
MASVQRTSCTLDWLAEAIGLQPGSVAQGGPSLVAPMNRCRATSASNPKPQLRAVPLPSPAKWGPGAPPAEAP